MPIKVKQYSLDGTYLRTFDSVKEAAEGFGKAENIIKCCRGASKTSYGYQWRFAEKCNGKENVAPVEAVKMRINQYTPDGKYLNTYESISEAARTITTDNTKTGITNISKCMKHQIKTAYGYQWQSAKECIGTEDIAQKKKAVRDKQKVRINQYSLDGRYMHTYASVKEAKEAVGASGNAGIIACAKGNRKIASGYQWKYTDECNGTENIAPVFTGKKAVNQYSIDGKYLHTYESLTEAAYAVKPENKNSGISVILSCAKGKKMTAFGYLWKYAKECNGTEDILPVHNSKSIVVNQYTLEGIYLNTYKSISEAARTISIPETARTTKSDSENVIMGNITSIISCISSCIRYRTKTAYGYQWKYAKECNGIENITPVFRLQKKNVLNDECCTDVQSNTENYTQKEFFEYLEIVLQNNKKS